MAEKVRNKSNFLEKALKVLFNIVIFFVCIIAFILLIYVFSAQLHKDKKNYKPFISFYTIVSPSMNPVIKVYDVVVNAKVSKPEDIKVGDIITYISTNSTSEGMTITHRVVAITRADNGSYEYQTQGDNNSEPDGVLVTFDNVIGKEIMIIPKLGKVQFLLANKKGWYMLLLIPILLFIFKDVYDLIELFGLRRRVDTVTGIVEEPAYISRKNEEKIEREKEQKEKEQKEKEKKEKEQKEILKRELSIHEVKEDANVRKNSEGNGFLEPYSETIVVAGKEVETKKEKEEVEPIKIVIPDLIEGEEIIPNTDNEVINEKIKEIEPVLSPIEILDTDDLTRKIKVYDEKLAKLNEMLIDLEKMKVDQEKEWLLKKETAGKEIELEKEKARAEIEKEKAEAAKEIKDIKDKKEEKTKTDPKKIVDNYLIGKKIKVVNTVETRKKPRSKKKKDDTKVLLGKPKGNVNNRLVIEKPNSVDISKVRNAAKEEEIAKKKVKPIIDNRDLNLKDNMVSKKKKVLTSADVVLKELNTLNKKEDKDLIFNPKMIKRVDTGKTDIKEKKKEKKRGLIYIEKRKKD